MNVQKRVGARILEESTECRVCGKHVDPFLEHSEVCVIAEATRGHYACVRALVNGLRLADSAVKTDPRGLTSTNARLADIAVPGPCAALDVCVASQNASAAGDGAAEAAFKRKLSHYRDIITELHRAGIAFRP